VQRIDEPSKSSMDDLPPKFDLVNNSSLSSIQYDGVKSRVNLGNEIPKKKIGVVS
jgi:hypothetical protein